MKHSTPILAAILPSCRPEIRDWWTDRDVALAMGNVSFEDAKGTEVVVDKTFGYHRNAEGALQIALHHSSLPYTPPTNQSRPA